MKLVELTEPDKESYNQFVALSETGSFLQSWEWGDWQARLGRTVFRFKILDDGGQIGAVQFIKMPLPFGKYYLYAPYGPVLSGQWAVDSHQFLQMMGQQFSEAIFIRIEPKFFALSTSQYPLITKSANIQPSKTLIIDLTKSEEQLLAEMHHKTRYNIKLAQKHAVEIKDEFAISVGHGLFFDEVLKLIQETSRRQKFTTFPQSYYKDMADFFALGARGAISLHIYKAVYQNQLLGSAFMLDFGNTRTFLFGGSGELHKNVMAPYLLHWQAMVDAKNQGLNFYDFWGIETSAGDIPGFVRFKLGFGGEQKQYAGTYDVIIKPAQYKLYRLFRVAKRQAKKIRS